MMSASEVPLYFDEVINRIVLEEIGTHRRLDGRGVCGSRL